MIYNQPQICTACGTQYPADNVPDICPICDDDRQVVPPMEGQAWTTHEQLLQTHSSRILQLKERVYELEIVPSFAIGQRALLILSDAGNILWDCFPLLTKGAIEFIKSKGGLDAIAFSHPHYYSNMNHWAETFDCPIYIHKKDEVWISDKGNHVKLWEGSEKTLWDDMQLINIGGHFPGSSILHVPFLSENGSVFCGDTLVIAPSKEFINVMYSFPNRIPLPRKEVASIKRRLEKLEFDELYGFWSYQNLTTNVKATLNSSLEKHLQ